jgi:hypothetical protein
MQTEVGRGGGLGEAPLFSGWWWRGLSRRSVIGLQITASSRALSTDAALVESSGVEPEQMWKRLKSWRSNVPYRAFSLTTRPSDAELLQKS